MWRTFSFTLSLPFALLLSTSLPLFSAVETQGRLLFVARRRCMRQMGKADSPRLLQHCLDGM